MIIVLSQWWANYSRGPNAARQAFQLNGVRNLSEDLF